MNCAKQAASGLHLGSPVLGVDFPDATSVGSYQDYAVTLKN